MDEIKLKPCPFCGGEATVAGIYSSNGTKFFVACTVCGIETPRIFRTRETAAKVWGHRVNTAENPMLTREELAQMQGEPVWIVWPDGRIKSKWWLVGSIDWMDMFLDWGGALDKECGKTWQAYRHKKEG